MSRSLPRVGVLTLILAASGPAVFSQSMTTGAISGILRGPDGSPVAGAVVTVSSNQVRRSTVSQANGTYHFGLLNPGDWVLEVTKPGFVRFQTRLSVVTNNDQTVNVKLGVMKEMVVEVVETGGTVDFTSTTQGLNLDRKTIDSLPKTRNFNSLALLAPGSSTDYSPGVMGVSGVNISGASAAENQFVIDGMNTNDYRFGTQSSGLKTDFIEQVEVQTGGFRPEYSALGGVVNVVTKSGTNARRGSAWMTWDPGGSQAVAKGNEFVKQEPPRSRTDFGFELGGPVIKEKLFYFAGVDSESSKGQRPLPNDDPGLVGGRPTLDRLQALGKINWFATQDIQFTFAASTDVTKANQDPIYQGGGTLNQGLDQRDTVTNLSLSFDWTISPTLLLSAKVGSVKISTDYDYAAESVQPTQAVWDYFYYIGGPGAATHPELAGKVARYSGGRGVVNTAPTDSTSSQARIDLSWLWNQHSFKFGFSQIDATVHNGQTTTGPLNPLSENGRYPLLYYILPNDWPMLDLVELHSQTTGKSRYSAFYAQDIWEAMPGLRLMYGARMESQSVRQVGGPDILSFKGKDYIQPRLGLTWDPANDGRTKFSASYAVYYEAMPSFIAVALAGDQTFTQRIYGYFGPSSAFAYNDGHPVILDPNGYDLMQDSSGQTKSAPVADGIKLPKRTEWILGFDKDLSRGWWLGLHAKYRKLTDPIEISALADAAGNYYDSGVASAFIGGSPVQWPGQGILWNPGPTASWTARTDPSSLNSGRKITVNDTLYPKMYNEYKSVDVSLSKRSDRDALQFSYTWSRLSGNYQGVSYSASPSTTSAGFANIGQAYNSAFMVGTGLLVGDRTHAFKLQASHRFTVAGNDLNVGLNGDASSGVPITHFDNHGDFTGAGAASPVDGRLGQFGRTPWITHFDLHLDYQVNLPMGLKATPFLDCFNLFNTRKTTYVYETATQAFTGDPGDPDPKLEQPRAWVQGRRYTLGVKIQF